MQPIEFGYQIGLVEKQAAGAGRFFARLLNAAEGVGSGARRINTGARGIVSGFGQGVRGLGEMVGTRARPAFDAATGTSLGNSKGLGGLFLGLGREMQTTGKGMINAIPSGKTRTTRDIRGVLGHGMRLTGSGVRGVGHTVNLAGEGLQAVGAGLNSLAKAKYGVPTLAAAGLLGGTAAVAPKIPLPGLRFQSPIDIDFKYKTQRPVEFEW